MIWYSNPIFWANQKEELQDMIDERDERLLDLLRDDVVKDGVTVCGREFSLEDKE